MTRSSAALDGLLAGTDGLLADATRHPPNENKGGSTSTGAKVNFARPCRSAPLAAAGSRASLAFASSGMLGKLVSRE